MRRVLTLVFTTMLASPGWAGLEFEQPPAAPAPASRPARPRPPVEPPAGRPAERPHGTADAHLLQDPRARCAVWVPDPQPGEAGQWTGSCSNGLAQGVGEFSRQVNGVVTFLYQGGFEAGRLNGRASRIGADGERLEAMFRDGRANGQGSMTYRDGLYEGEFRDDLPHGQGIRSWRSFRPWLRYEGGWLNGRRHGTGSMDYGNGAHYEGEWRNDRRDGSGSMDYGNGTRYVGRWREDQREGQGTFHWNLNGASGMYVGEWANDRRNGLGAEIFNAQGARIDGRFVDDAADGPGSYTIGQRQIQGMIRNGCLRTERGEAVRILTGATCR